MALSEGGALVPPDEGPVVPAHLVSDLHLVRPAVFWADLIACAVIGWSAFGAAISETPFSAAMILASAVAAFALYRGLCFTHELAHLRRGSLRGFETAWNILFGVPLLLPSFTYIGVHQFHHNLSTYGTREDPEYLPFAKSRRLIVLFALQTSLVLPLLMAVRFLLFALVGLASRRFHRWLEIHASSFAMNPSYQRVVSDSIAKKMRRWEAAVLCAWAAFFITIEAAVVPRRALLVWYVVVAFVSFLNTLRVFGAHRYESEGAPLSRVEQLQDSIDTPGGPWTELWAPVGLRYHALHHFFPGIPYHNLGKAYRRIVSDLPKDSVYRESISASLAAALKRLHETAKQARTPVVAVQTTPRA